MSDVTLRTLRPADLTLIGEIDRSERQTIKYVLEGGSLRAIEFDFDVPTWHPDGKGEHSVAGVIAYWRPVVEAGAQFFGAFAGKEVAGLTIVEPDFETDMSWLAFFYVSRPYRRHGVGSSMWEEALRLSRDAGARGIYISAVPSDSAVGFYLSKGCRLAGSDSHPELVAAEPEDIQLVYEL